MALALCRGHWLGKVNQMSKWKVFARVQENAPSDFIVATRAFKGNVYGAYPTQQQAEFAAARLNRIEEDTGLDRSAAMSAEMALVGRYGYATEGALELILSDLRFWCDREGLDLAEIDRLAYQRYCATRAGLSARARAAKRKATA